MYVSLWAYLTEAKISYFQINLVCSRLTKISQYSSLRKALLKLLVNGNFYPYHLQKEPRGFSEIFQSFVTCTTLYLQDDYVKFKHCRKTQFYIEYFYPLIKVPANTCREKMCCMNRKHDFFFVNETNLTPGCLCCPETYYPLFQSPKNQTSTVHTL